MSEPREPSDSIGPTAAAEPPSRETADPETAGPGTAGPGTGSPGASPRVSRPGTSGAAIRVIVAPFLVWLVVMTVLAVARAQSDEPGGAFWIGVFTDGSALAFLVAAVVAVVGVVVVEGRRTGRP